MKKIVFIGMTFFLVCGIPFAYAAGSGTDQSQSANNLNSASDSGILDGKNEFTNGIVHCGRKVDDPTHGITSEPCTFNDLLILASRVIRFAMYLIAIAAAIVIIYIGWIFLTAGGSTEKLAKAKHAAISWVTGVALILCAWLAVSFVIRSLLSKEYLAKHPNAILLEKVDDSSTQTKSLQDIITGK